MADVTRERFNKTENEKADVMAEGDRRVQSGIAESFTVEDGGKDWVLVTVLKDIS